VISKRRPITPGKSISFRRRLNRCRVVAFIALDLRKNIESVRVKEQIRSALGRFPDIIQQFARRSR
jgi:hypothetical protein